MAKYYFREKLEEGILYTKSGILTTVISGTEYKAVFPPGRNPKHVERESIPCLARKCSNTEMKCMVEAVSADSLELEKKDWTCINPLLLKNAVEFFLSSYSMVEIARCYPNYKKDQIIASQCIDFIASDGTMIDLKVLNTGVEAAYGRKPNGKYSILTPPRIHHGICKYLKYSSICRKPHDSAVRSAAGTGFPESCSCHEWQNI